MTTFDERGEEYDVYLRGDENSSNNAADLSQIYMRTATGELVTLDTVTRIDVVASAIRLAHFNKQKSITITANLEAGYTLGQALDFLDQKRKRYCQMISPLATRVSRRFQREPIKRGHCVCTGAAGCLFGAGCSV